MKKQYIVILAISLTVIISLASYAPAQNSVSNDLESKQQVLSNQEDIKDEKNRKSEDYYSELGFDLMQNETIGSLKYGLSSVKVRALLGEPDKKSKQEVWGADGEEHQTWHYKNQGIELDMIGTKNKQEINMITINNPSILKTSRNIGLSSTKEEVLKAYREEINPDTDNSETLTDPDAIIAGTIYGGIIFKLKDNRVSSIFIGAGAE